MSSFLDNLTGVPEGCTAISEQVFLDIDPTAQVERNVLIIVLAVAGAAALAILAFFALSRTVRMMFTILFDMADLVTDILFVWDMVQSGNLQWAIISGVVVGFHLLFAFFSLCRERRWRAAFFALFQLHIPYQAYKVTQSPDETTRKLRMSDLRRMKMFNIALEAIPQTLVQMTIWVSDDYDAGAILYLSLAASLFNATYTLTIADQDMNLFELAFWLFELLSRMAALAIFCTAFKFYAVAAFVVIFATRVIYIRYVTNLKKTNFEFTEDEDRREWSYLRFATMLMSPMIDGFLSIIGNDFVIPYFRRLVVLEVISAYEIGAMLVLSAAYGTQQPCGYRKLLWVLIAACFLLKCVMLSIQFICQGGRLQARSMTAPVPHIMTQRHSRVRTKTDPSINVEFVDVEMGETRKVRVSRSKSGRHSPTMSVSDLSASYNSVSKSGFSQDNTNTSTTPAVARKAPRSKSALKLSPDSNSTRSSVSRRKSGSTRVRSSDTHESLSSQTYKPPRRRSTAPRISAGGESMSSVDSSVDSHSVPMYQTVPVRMNRGSSRSGMGADTTPPFVIDPDAVLQREHMGQQRRRSPAPSFSKRNVQDMSSMPTPTDGSLAYSQKPSRAHRHTRQHSQPRRSKTDVEVPPPPPPDDDSDTRRSIARSNVSARMKVFNAP